MPAPGEPLPTTLPATLSLGQAAATPWQVVIGGAGPAGAAAALRFARGGLRVLLVDRGSMPRWKVCGCCLSRTALDELRRLGSVADDGQLLPEQAVPLEQVRLSAAGHSATIPLPGGAVVSREALDHTLVMSAIRAGCHWLPDTQIVTASDERGAHGAGGASILVRHPAGAAGTQATLRADLVVIATGLGGHVRTEAAGGSNGHRLRAPAERRSIDRGSRIGLGATLPAGAIDLQPGLLEMAVSREGYCGMIRLEDGRIDVAAAVDPRALQGATDPAQVLLQLLRTTLADGAAAVAAGPLLAAAAFQATPRLTHAASVATSPTGRILRAGDAAAYVEPFTGEGIGWALSSGRILAEALMPALLTGNSTAAAHAAAVADYRHAHLRHFRPLHARCRLMALALRRPALVATAIRATRLAPWLAARIVPRLIGGGPAAAQPARA